MMQKISLSHNLAQAAIEHLFIPESSLSSNDANVVSSFVKSIAKTSNSGSESSSSSESSRVRSLALSYECSSFGSGDESEPEGVHP